MNRWCVLLGLSGLAPVFGCSAPPRPPPEQLDAIQTVLVDAPRDEVYRAAAGVMMDNGLVLVLSDFGAGLLSAGRWGEVEHSGHAEHPGPRSHPPLLVWVRRDGAACTRMRVSLEEAEDVRRFADQVRARCLAAAPMAGRSP
jgi:hypothetical protein